VGFSSVNQSKLSLPVGFDGLFKRGEHHSHLPSFQIGPLFYGTHFLQFFGYAFHHFLAEFRISDLPPSESHDYLNLLPFLQPSTSFTDIQIAMEISDFRTQLDRLNLDLFLMLACFSLFSGLLVNEFAVIHYPHHRRVRIWRYLNQIKFSLVRNVDSFLDRNHTTIIAGMIDQTDLLGPNTVIYAIVATD